jgi:SNF2 family DNA or RNA helicase
MATGVAKAKAVAEYVKILLENDEPVLLAGWHRDCYAIWLKELAAYAPVMYTGSESPNQKEQSKEAFIAGKSKLMIISLRSGVGLDGLQVACSTVVFGELDWSPKVHDQVIGRVNRDGQDKPVTGIFLVCDGGSDPPMVDLLGLKAEQADGINDPFAPTGVVTEGDESRIQEMARRFLLARETRCGKTI